MTTKPILSFQDTPASIKTLRAFTRRRLPPTIPVHLRKQMFHDGARTALTLYGASLDDALIYKLSESMAYDLDERGFQQVFRYDGPLGSFGSRTEVAHLFGFIDEHTRRQLTIFRELRNAAAHAHGEIDWFMPELTSAMRRLFPDPILATLDIPHDRNRNRPRIWTGSLCHVEFMFLYYTLTLGSVDAAHAACEADLKKIGSRELLDSYGTRLWGYRGEQFSGHFDFPDSYYIVQGVEGHRSL